jgi:hypothetical protein
MFSRPFSPSPLLRRQLPARVACIGITTITVITIDAPLTRLAP